MVPAKVAETESVAWTLGTNPVVPESVAEGVSVAWTLGTRLAAPVKVAVRLMTFEEVPTNPVVPDRFTESLFAAWTLGTNPVMPDRTRLMFSTSLAVVEKLLVLERVRLTPITLLPVGDRLDVPLRVTDAVSTT